MPRAPPLFIMSKLTDITAIFQKASDAFYPITAKPRDDDLQRINKTLVVCTLSVTLTGTTSGCASSVVLPDPSTRRTTGGCHSISCVTRVPITTRPLREFRRTTILPKCAGWNTAGQPGLRIRAASALLRWVRATSSWPTLNQRGSRI